MPVVFLCRRPLDRAPAPAPHLEPKLTPSRFGVDRYNPELGMRGLIAPRLVGSPRAGSTRRVRMLSPATGLPVGDYVAVNSTADVEFLERTPHGMRLLVEQLAGRDAYCVAFLRKAYADSCWAALDP